MSGERKLQDDALEIVRMANAVGVLHGYVQRAYETARENGTPDETCEALMSVDIMLQEIDERLGEIAARENILAVCRREALSLITQAAE